MNGMPLRRTAEWVVGLLLAAGTATAGESELSKLQRGYAAACRTLETRVTEHQRAATRNYVAALRSNRDTLRVQGDLAGYLAASEELKRFAREGTPPEGEPPAAIREHAAVLCTALDACNAKATAGRVELQQRYVDTLERLVVYLTREGRMLQAQQAAEARDAATAELAALRATIQAAQPEADAAPDADARTAAELPVPAELRPHLLAWYHFDDDAMPAADGTPHARHARAGRDGTPGRMPADWWSPTGRGGGSFRIGDGRTLIADVNLDQSVATDGGTLMCWIKPIRVDDESKGYFLISGGGGWDWALTHTGGSWDAYTGRTMMRAEARMRLHRWQHVAAVFQPGVGTTLYVNGQKQHESGIDFDNKSEGLRIGSQPNSMLAGYMDDVMVFDVPLNRQGLREIIEATEPD